MRWSPTRLAPCRRSTACPRAMSLLASMRQMWLTTPPHCKAYAVMLPTRPPPPMMLTFMHISSSGTQCRHDLIGDDPHQRFDVRSWRRLSIGAGEGMVLVAFEHLRLGGKFT